MQDKKALSIVVFGVALALSLVTFPPWDTLTYDGALYIDIARNLAKSPANFTYQGVYMMYRPPFYPYTLSLFFHFLHDPLNQLKVARLVSAIFFSLTAVLTFLLALELLKDGKKALMASAFFILNPLAFTMGTRELVHSEFTFFYTLAVYLLYTGKRKREGIRIYLAFLSAGLAILTRYTGLSIVGVFLLYLWLTEYWEWTKRREYWLGFGVLALTLAPWLYLGHLHYGGFLRPFEVASRVVTLDRPIDVSTYFKWLEKDLGRSFLVLVFFGLIRLRQDEEGWLILSWFSVGLLGILTVTHKETRFITFLSPVMAILAFKGVELMIEATEKALPTRINPKEWKKPAVLALSLLLLIPVGLNAVHLKERWNAVGQYDSRVLRYSSEHYTGSELLVSPYLYTMAGFYYPGAHVEMILKKKSVEEKIAKAEYDVIIHKDPNTYLNILTSGNYVLVKEFYGGKFKVFVAKRLL
ncbi:glycosyltransferase family 39 protein [Thermococcus sp.]|uniref:ArnT family glycosyltransferase n=1 Tax=Thermococcus sp. TaxID=35749 RepID=UPI002601C3CE|nr:glycosyltransferase family 39 protein [Thermococcus sp.]